MLDPSPSRQQSRRDRDRRYRRRARRGLMVVPVEVGGDMVSFLRATDWLKPDEADSKQAIGEAIGEMVRAADAAGVKLAKERRQKTDGFS